ncbi:phosphoglycerate mutase-like protein [Hortaea werneckii]|uniref:Uncharacterized protein n=1 Tax=Hortaea werneckii TaxID=91943 RepID=A0A3M7F5N7_HORWE|nr:phosphoglycerate mutase-like protein [Hortaea werneckii]RMY83896.1 hypothetical protein D0861_07204 [Hortaea werneckii]
MRFHCTSNAVLTLLSSFVLVCAHAEYGTSAPATTASLVCLDANTTSVDLSWHPPNNSSINDLETAINGTGIYGFIFNSSQGPPDTYNWCNMPHVNPQTYPQIHDTNYKLEYVEVVHRHHKRTPYASNTFPQESYPWYCDDEGLFYGGKPLNPSGNLSADTYWDVYTSPSNPLAPEGFNGSCQFPQITRGGLDDSHQHGVDLKAVYGGMLNFLPEKYDGQLVSYRVTNNQITSQVASMLVAGMYPSRADREVPLLIQPESIDSLKPTYTCDYASDLFSSYGSGSSNPAWREHLDAASSLYRHLDTLSGVSPASEAWHMSLDHYFDNLSARLCHDKPLPCSVNDTTGCVTMAEADQVFRLGEYEYSFIYRDSSESFPASVSSYGIWVAELAQNFRNAMDDASSAAKNATGGQRVRYRHNVAHDGSISRLLSILQLEKMVWPGMGAEVVFELYSHAGCYYVRVLWSGQVMQSSNPSLGRMDMVPVHRLLAYFDGLVGVGASKIPDMCRQ